MAKNPQKDSPFGQIVDTDDLAFDFGFSFEDSVSTKEALAVESEKVNDAKQRLDKLYAAILPFLNNLCKNPDKDTIVWPNRVEKIEDFKKKLEKIVKGA